jgi:hypothetical protein
MGRYQHLYGRFHDPPSALGTAVPIARHTDRPFC